MGNGVQLLANWRQIAKDLAEQIGDGRLTEGERLPSEFVLAERMGVSRQTVHRALAELKVQGLVTRQRRTGTVVSTRPSLGARTRTGMVALIMDYATAYPQADLVLGIQAALPEGEGLILFDVGADAASEAERLRKAAVTADAIFIYPSCDPRNTPLIASIAAAGATVVCIDRVPDGLDGKVDAVLSDNYAVTARGVRALIEAGHRRIAFLSGDNEDVSSVVERHAAYRAELERVGAYDPRLERWFPKTLESRPERLRIALDDAFWRLADEPQPPTAVFSVQDVYAAYARESAERAGLALEWLTFNDWPAGMLPRGEECHRIVQRPFEMGRVAAERFLRRHEGEDLALERVTVGAEVHPPASAIPLSPPVRPVAHAAARPDFNGENKPKP